MKQNIEELSHVRAIAILAVVLIHVTASARVSVPAGSLSFPVYFTANQLSMFAVPVFIMLSGIVLFYRYFDSWPKGEWMAFYRKRLQFIVIPYLVWALFYYLFNQWISSRQLGFDAADFFQKLLWGKTGYHLYFMVIIIQFYIVFPLLVTLLRRLGRGAWSLVVAGFVIQAIFYAAHLRYGPIPHLSALLPNYLFVFCAGGAIGIAYRKFAERSGHLWWTFGASVAVGYTYMLLLLNAADGAKYWPPVYVVLYNAYAVLLGVSLIWMTGKWKLHTTLLTRSLRSIGALSFGIYFIHPAILTLWRMQFNPPSGHPLYHAYNLATMVIVFALSWLVVHLICKMKFSWVLFGKSEAGNRRRQVSNGPHAAM
jgi:peptidoglycan/LPS O-acetylase OafA/YrhL